MFKQGKTKFLLISIFVFLHNLISAQETRSASVISATQILDERGEVIIRFIKPSSVNISDLSSFLSIDKFQNDTITAYANKTGYKKFLEYKIGFVVLDPPFAKMLPHAPQREIGSEWEIKYPSYSEYLQLMQNFADNNPEICKLYEFGVSMNGHKLLALKISDNVNVKEQEPVVFYTSTIHGDEPLGYCLMLKLISYMLVNYHSDNNIKSIIDSTEIWINPLSNPDGTYFQSDNSVNGATRFNAANVDLNRDFPNVNYDYFNKNQSQPENIAMMNLMEELHPDLAANFHGGAEVINYPWDSWSFHHADDSWYIKISRSYADTVHKYAPQGYMTFLNNGITNGYDWYQITGGRQDYLNYFLHGREVTIELSNNKMPDENTLSNFWNYNKKSLIQYIAQAMTGIKGQVTDSLTGIPVTAKIIIPWFDKDNSFILSKQDNGSFFRLLKEGKYQLLISATGYYDKTMDVNVRNENLTYLDIKLFPDNTIHIYPNPFDNYIYIDIHDPGSDLEVTLINIAGQKVQYIRKHKVVASPVLVRLNDVASGYYIVQIKYGSMIMNIPAIKISKH